MEVLDPEHRDRRYCLCRNPQSAQRETRTRAALMDRTRKRLDAIAGWKKRASVKRIAQQVGQIFSRTRMGKFVDWRVEEGRLVWQWRAQKVQDEEALDGCYIIKTDVSSKQMTRMQVVAAYKKLSLVDHAFRNLKTVQLEIRPVYHKLDDRIRGHVFLCMLAYYLQWHMEQRLAPLFAADGEEKNRFWTLENVMERLKSLRREVREIAGVSCQIVGDPDEDQQRILELLKVKL